MNKCSENFCEKELYGIGELPPKFHVPKLMHAWVIRRERHGVPDKAFKQEIVPIPGIKANEVLILVMSAGVNYNGVWAGLGIPISPFDIHKCNKHIAGSDASGIIWAKGDQVQNWNLGDEVVVHCNQDDGNDIECNGGDPMLSKSQRIWGYETPDGSFAQFTKVQAKQLLRKPKHLSWEQSACYTLTLATSYRMLFGHPPHDLKPGQNVLVWGASGGLGGFAVQLINLVGANSIGVISDEKKQNYIENLGVGGVINRKDFDCWGAMPEVNSKRYKQWMAECQKFGREIWNIIGKKENVDLVFEHSGQETFPVSTYLCKKGGMVVFCAATSGYYLSMDARYVWMHQKRIQGSHFANLKQAFAANELMAHQKLDPCLGEVFDWHHLPEAHKKMYENSHLPGNMAILVQSSSFGLGANETCKGAQS